MIVHMRQNSINNYERGGMFMFMNGSRCNVGSIEMYTIKR